MINSTNSHIPDFATSSTKSELTHQADSYKYSLYLNQSNPSKSKWTLAKDQK